MSKVTLLVGAGLVEEAKLPMSVQLAGKLKDTLNKKCGNDLDKEGAETARSLLATLRFLIGGIHFKEGVLDRDPDCPVNIEQIAVAALELQARLENALAPYASGWHQRIVELEARQPDILSKFIDFIYSQLETWLTIGQEEDIAYLARLSDLSDVGEGVDIFSLNYDLCIETALSAIAEKRFVNGFSDDGWHPDLLNEECPIRLLKLHGSLDWFDDDGALGICSSKFPKHKDIESLPEELRPLLIFGTNHKLSARQPFLTLAYHFSQSVLNSPILAIVGYSFGDSYINEIIEQGFRTNSKLRIVIVSPNAEKRVRENALFCDNPRVKPLNKGAKEAFNNSSLLNVIRALLREVQEEEPF